MDIIVTQLLSGCCTEYGKEMVLDLKLLVKGYWCYQQVAAKKHCTFDVVI